MIGIGARKENKTKSILALTLAFMLAFCALGVAETEKSFADTKAQTALAYLKPDVTIVRNGEILNFFDETGKQVYPVIFRNRTYLPLRALCGILGEEVEWVGDANTIYIGKTLSHPSKSFVKPETSPYVKKVSDAAVGAQSIVKAYVKDSIYIMRDFEGVTFTDSDGNVQYPINVGGTTYLPISALGDFLAETISWDNETKTVVLGSREIPVEEPAKVEKTDTVKTIAEFYEKQVALYNEATELVLLISSSSQDELNLLASDISNKYIIATKYNNDVKYYAKSVKDKEALISEEADALASLCDFAEFSEHYLLVMENMMCLAAQGQDYSVFAETFLNFAMMTQNAMDATAKRLEALL